MRVFEISYHFRVRARVYICVCGFIKAAFAKDILVLVAVIGVLPILNAIS